MTGEPEPEIDAMYRVAEDWEADVLDQLRRRAGITWEHTGCWTNYADVNECERCGRSRADIEANP